MTQMLEDRLNLADDPQALKRLLQAARALEASDVILRTHDVVWMRVHGKWTPATRGRLNESDMQSAVRLIALSEDIYPRVLSGEDKDLHYEVLVSRGHVERFRVNITACYTEAGSGVCMTLRSIPRHPPPLSSLGLQPALFEAIIRPGFGLILVTGPVGSGKSTLLAAALRHIAEREPRHIITYEAPVEFDLTTLPERIAPVEQTEVGMHLVHLDDRKRDAFSLAPRNSLRRAGDVVLVGEARDAETIRAMAILAQTGVAVYTTAHTSGVADTLIRLVREFPSQAQLAIFTALVNSVRLIVHQRLAPSADGRRVAIREWLEVDREAFARLSRCQTPEDSVAVLRLLVRERKQSLYHDLLRQREVIAPEAFERLERDYLMGV